MAEVTLGQLSQATVGTFELGVAVLLLTTGRIDARRAAAAVLLLAHSVSMWALANGVDVGGALLAPGWGVLDHIIVYTVAFLLTQFPTPILGRQGNRWLVVGWIGVVLFGVALIQTNTDPLGDWNLLPPGNSVMGRMQAFAFPLGAAIGIFHTLPRAMNLEPGPLRTQALLVFVALTANIFYYGVIQLDWILTDFSDGRLPLKAFKDDPTIWDDARTILMTLVGLAGFYTLVKCSAYAAQRRDSVVAFVATLLFVASLRGLSGFITPETLDVVIEVPSEFMSQMIRPTLLSVALVRYDLFLVPWRIRTTMHPIMLGLLALSLFSLFVAVLQRDAWNAPQIDSMAIVLSMGLTGIAFAGVRRFAPDLARIPRPGHKDDLDQRMRRYRLAMERDEAMGLNHQGPELARLRRQLKITSDQHDAISSLLAGQVVMPRMVAHGLQPGDILQHRYRIIERLGSGGQGNAFLAADERTGTQVVVKEVGLMWRMNADDHVRRLRREGELSQVIDAPHVAKTLALVEHEWGAYLVREYIEGATLEERLQASPAGLRQEAEKIAKGVAQGLSALHGQGIIHGDVKPANIVLDHSRGPVLIDLGVAARQPDADATAVLPSPVGLSNAWASPEQRVGHGAMAASDMYQLGLVWCAMREGNHECGVGCTRANGLVKNLLCADPAARSSAAQVISALQSNHAV